jgi:hypothetical protein
MEARLRPRKNVGRHDAVRGLEPLPVAAKAVLTASRATEELITRFKPADLTTSSSMICSSGFLRLFDQLLESGSRCLALLRQINGGFAQAREIRVRKVLRLVRGQDLQREVLGKSPDQLLFGYGGPAYHYFGQDGARGLAADQTTGSALAGCDHIQT